MKQQINQKREIKSQESEQEVSREDLQWFLIVTLKFDNHLNTHINALGDKLHL